MPEATLNALADHGDVDETLPARARTCDDVLARFAKAGIDTDALAAQLQDEGAKGFVKSWNDLMECIASKSAVAQKGRLNPIEKEHDHENQKRTYQREH